MSDRYAWIHEKLTQELIAGIGLERSRLVEHMAKGGSLHDAIDQTALKTSNIVGRIMLIDNILDGIKAGMELEEEEKLKEDTSEDYNDA